MKGCGKAVVTTGQGSVRFGPGERAGAGDKHEHDGAHVTREVDEAAGSGRGVRAAQIRREH